MSTGSSSITRADGRTAEQMRSVSFASGENPYAEGSTVISFGATRVLATASVENEVPRWMGDNPHGWITGEYGMLPRATHTRNRREAAAGKQGGRTLEIQRLIGRSLRAAVNLKDLGEVTIKVDCDVLVADGGTRTASITGAWVALHQAIAWAKEQGIVKPTLEVDHIVAVSAGSVAGELCLDLCYEEDSQAEFDCNFVFNQRMEIIEVQGTAEGRALGTNEFQQLLQLAQGGAEKLISLQKQAVG